MSQPSLSHGLPCGASHNFRVQYSTLKILKGWSLVRHSSSLQAYLIHSRWPMSHLTPYLTWLYLTMPRIGWEPSRVLPVIPWSDLRYKQRNQTSFQTQPSRLEESGGFSEICMIGGSFNHLKQGLSALFWPINPQSNAVRTSNGSHLQT